MRITIESVIFLKNKSLVKELSRNTKITLIVNQVCIVVTFKQTKYLE
jgi:hypothetical protein